MFEVCATPARARRNPKTGALVNVLAGKRVRFKAGRVMMLRVQLGPDDLGAIVVRT